MSGVGKKSLKTRPGARLFIGLLAMAMLCIFAQAEEETAQSWLKKAYDLSANGSDEQALVAYEKAIQIDGRNGLAWINKAYSLTKLNRTQEANDAYQRALDIVNESIESDPENSSLWASKGLLCHNIGNPKEAANAFERATEIDPKDLMSWMMLGVTLSSDLHRYNESILAFDNALQMNPNDKQVLALKADALNASGRRSEACDTYAEAEKLSCSSSASQGETIEYWLKKANEFRYRGSFEESAKAYDKALQLDPGNASIWLNKALDLGTIGRENESIRAYETALQLTEDTLKANPRDARAWHRKGQILSNLGRDEDALQAYENSSEHHRPDSGE